MIDNQSIKNFWFSWNKWKELYVNRKIFSASLAIGLLTLIAGVFSLAKELVVAYKFGTSGELDAFLIAFLLPTFAVGVMANSLPSAFIPTYIDARESKGRDEACKLFYSVFLRFLGLLLLSAAVFGALLYYFIPAIYSGLSGENIILTQKLFLVMMPFLVINGLAKLFTAVLNAEEDFAFAGISPVCMPLFAVISLLIFEPIFGIHALAYGVLAGSFIELCLLAVRVIKKKLFLVFHRTRCINGVRKVASQYAPMVIGMLMVASVPLIDQSMASMLGEGHVSAYNYGSRIVYFALGLATVSLGTAVFPYFSKMSAEKDWVNAFNTFRTYKRIIIIAGGIFSIIMFSFSETIVGFLFQRGEFTAEDTTRAGLVQAFFSLQVPFYIGQILTVRFLSALKKNRILMWVSMNTVALNIVFNYIFMRIYGVAGIAISTSLVALIMFIVLNILLVRKLRC